VTIQACTFVDVTIQACTFVAVAMVAAGHGSTGCAYLLVTALTVRALLIQPILVLLEIWKQFEGVHHPQQADTLHPGRLSAKGRGQQGSGETTEENGASKKFSKSHC